MMNTSVVLLAFAAFSLASANPAAVRGIKNYFPTFFTRAGHPITHTDKFVAFSTGLTQQLVTNDTDVIAYDRVFLNLGKGYDRTTGIFTCPHAGTYAFLLHGLSQANMQVNLDIYHNSNYTVSLFGHSRNGYAAGHQAIVLKLDEQDEVYIQARGPNSMFGQPDEVYSTFSGFMVVPDIGRTVRPTTVPSGNIIG